MLPGGIGPGPASGRNAWSELFHLSHVRKYAPSVSFADTSPNAGRTFAGALASRRRGLPEFFGRRPVLRFSFGPKGRLYGFMAGKFFTLPEYIPHI